MKRILILFSLGAAFLTSAIVSPRATQVMAAAHVAATAPVVYAPHAHPMLFDRTRFLIHAGVAFFIVHHEYKRYREGYFHAGTSGRLRHIFVAALALAFAYHEARVAYRIAERSHSRTLHALAAPFAALSGRLSSTATRLKGGQFNQSDLSGLNGATGRINGAASSTGFGAIPDRSIALPVGA